MMVKREAPPLINISVRIPASLPARFRSSPTIAPRPNAIKSRTIICSNPSIILYSIVPYMRIAISDIPQHEGKEVELFGWVHARRDHGKLIFIDLRDRSGLAQIVFGPDIKGASDLRLEYVVKLKGMVKARPANMINE